MYSRNPFYPAIQVVLLLVLLVIVASMLWLAQQSGVAHDIALAQKALHEQLAEHVQNIQSNPFQSGVWLIGISLFYGLFHAVGPGHGKVIISSYLATQNSTIRYGMGISFIAALLQSTVAVMVVSGLHLFLSMSLRSADAIGNRLELASYGLIGVIGIMILWRAVQSWRAAQGQKNAVKHRHQHHHDVTGDHNHEGHRHDAHCGCQHTTDAEPKGLKESLLLVFSMGLRPCTGALIVLMYAYVVDLHVYGIAAAYAMGVGTGGTLALLALCVILFRERLERFGLSQSSSSSHTLQTLIKFAGGLVLICLSIALLGQVSIYQAPSHPLF